MTDEERRQAIREELIERVGSAKAAFRFLDLSGSGRISPQEFEDGMSSLNMNLREVAGITRVRDAMKLFDYDKDLNINFVDMFPEEASGGLANGKRVGTPEFCRVYGGSRKVPGRHPEWQSADQEEELERLFQVSQKNSDAVLKRKWMAATLHRLKGKGKSDCRCRELVALHLPRGTGPKDRDGVSTFTGGDLRLLKQGYSDEINAPVRDLSRAIGDLKEQRKEQKRIYDKLYAVTEAEHQWERAQAALTAGLGWGNKKEQKESGAGGPRSVEDLAKECKMNQVLADDLFSEFARHSAKDGKLSYKAFAKLLKDLCPSRTLVESDLDAWWKQVVTTRPRSSGGEEEGGGLGLGLSGPGLRGGGSARRGSEDKWATGLMAKPGEKEEPQTKSCTFEQWILWYSASEFRGPDSVPLVAS
mmetsp:Transcript_94407/g.243814  ORF Transcript_94407/g.243814 Transcript_94407/m.243814 type:complete len:417 (-) Transcript_94407:133-1383(-)